MRSGDSAFREMPLPMLKFRGETKGDHVHLDVFAGPFEGNLGHCGQLTMRTEEWSVFSAVLLGGARGTDVAVVFEVRP